MSIEKEWLRAIYFELNQLDPVLLNQAITNLQERGEIE
tara:strand:+ start:199 stop:312 length:114 start_codon:yes stop_codon:yes gene_type:complete